MEHYTGKPLPDKCFHETWMENMLAGVRKQINFYMEGFDCDYQTAKDYVKPITCAGAKIWEIIDKEYGV